MERKTLIKIGLVSVISIAILIWGLSFLKGENLFTTENEYIAIYDKIDGLQESNVITISGFKIGKVTEINFTQDGKMKIEVKMHITNDFKIPKGTIAKIVNVDIMGTKGIEIICPKNYEAYHENGDTLKSAMEGGILDQMLDLVMPMKDDLVGFLSASDSVMHSLNQLLNEENRENINKSLNDLRILTNHLSGNSHRIDSVMKNFTKISESIGKNSNNIDRAINNFASLSDTLSQLNLSEAISDAQESLNQLNTLLSNINNGNGSVSKLINNDSIYNSLESASANIDKILKEFEENPKKYINLSIFGGKDKSQKQKNKQK
ncbi:MAG: MlaD family protein [Bacteroidales bacterium]|nr:MlaD family protein [Bacteroidales bacterium]